MRMKLHVVRIKSVNICAWHISPILRFTIIFYYLVHSYIFFFYAVIKIRNFEGKAVDFRFTAMGNYNFLRKEAA